MRQHLGELWRIRLRCHKAAIIQEAHGEVSPGSVQRNIDYA
jgi:hypothetical protein